jgi:hypothetical protein
VPGFLLEDVGMLPSYSIPEAIQILGVALAAHTPSHARKREASAYAGSVDALDIATRAVQLYAETHPRPTQVTQAQAAEMLGIHRHTVAKLMAAGSLRLNRCGMIPIEQVDQARTASAGKAPAARERP